MRPGKFARRLTTAGVLLLWLSPANVSAQLEAENADPVLHDHHAPAHVDARPIISRLKVPLVRPRRMLLDPQGSLFVADWGAGTVLRVTPDGEVSIVADKLNEPAGLARDNGGNLYVSTHAQGMPEAGTVIRISETGEQTVFAEGLSGPTGLAFDAHDNLFVANFDGNTIVRIGPDGDSTLVTDSIPTPAALVFDEAGRLFAVSSTQGTLYRISLTGEIAVLARGLQVPSDLAIDPEGHLIVTNFGGTELSYVDEKGEVSTFALVPKGTISLAFNHEGNLVLANWDYHFLLKVISNLTIPCPHCGKRIPIRLRPERKRKPPSKPANPMI